VSGVKGIIAVCVLVLALATMMSASSPRAGTARTATGSRPWNVAIQARAMGAPSGGGSETDVPATPFGGPFELGQARTP
jgi:hypothetical protein